MLVRMCARPQVRCDDNNVVRMDSVLTQLSRTWMREELVELRTWGVIHKDAIV